MYTVLFSAKPALVRVSKINPKTSFRTWIQVGPWEVLQDSLLWIPLSKGSSHHPSQSLACQGWNTSISEDWRSCSTSHSCVYHWLHWKRKGMKKERVVSNMCVKMTFLLSRRFCNHTKNIIMSAAHLELNLCREKASITWPELLSYISCYASPMSRLSSAIRDWRHSPCRL